MSWTARLNGRHSYVIGDDVVIILAASGPLDRPDAEHEANVLKAAAVEDLLESGERVAKFLRHKEGNLTVEDFREMRFTDLLNAIDKARGRS